MQAIDRARALVGAAFCGSAEVSLVVAVFTSGSGSGAEGLLPASFGALGLPTPRWTQSVQDERTDMGDPAVRRLLLVEQVRSADLPRLLWGVFARELGVTPTLPPCEIYLADPQRGVLLHPYDDRGMDIIGPNTTLLALLYRDFSGWLLEFDRERMIRIPIESC